MLTSVASMWILGWVSQKGNTSRPHLPNVASVAYEMYHACYHFSSLLFHMGYGVGGYFVVRFDGVVWVVNPTPPYTQPCPFVQVIIDGVQYCGGGIQSKPTWVGLIYFSCISITVILGYIVGLYQPSPLLNIISSKSPVYPSGKFIIICVVGV